jgi:hypothetical protein
MLMAVTDQQFAGRKAEQSAFMCNNFLKKENTFNLLKPTVYVMHQQFNIQQLYVLPTLYLCVLYLSENKQRLVPLTA